MADKILHTKAEVVSKNIDVEKGELDAVVGSTNVLDRYGDIIQQDGWDLKNFKKNPVILWGHNQNEERPPIGKALKVWVEGKGKKSKLMFKVKFDLLDNFAREIFRKIKDGFLNTVSVGFLPSEWEDVNPEEMFGGRKYTKQELLELSFVPVPANPEAVIALKSMKDKRVKPQELKEMYPNQKKEEKETYECECIDCGNKTTTSKHCKDIKCSECGGEMRRVERPGPGKKLDKVEVKEEEKSEEVKKPIKEEKPKSESNELEKEEMTIDTTEDEKVAENGANEEILEEKETVKEEKEPKVEEKPKEEEISEEKEEVKPEESKGIIRYKDHDTLPDSEAWDGPGEVSKAEVSDLKKICTWFNDEEPDKKSSYKLPHHKAEGYKAVWRGVASAMAVLLGANGGVDIPEADRKGVYNHLKKHYEQFEKDVPEFKHVENQILADFKEEIHATILDREDKYAVRLIKKVIKKQNKKVEGYTDGQITQALKLLDLALSHVTNNDSLKGGE